MEAQKDISGRIAFYTLGCKLNFSETSTIARAFLERGYQKVEFHEAPDVYVINTCSVTDHADRKCRKLVKQALKHNPEAYIAIIGCYAQLKPEEIASIPGVDLVLGAGEKFQLPEHIDRPIKKTSARILSSEIKTVNSFIPAFSEGDRTRTFFKVQDGCDYFCSFCTIPLARGESRSGDVISTLQELRKIESTKVKEVVLTGVNLGDFGVTHNESFFDLIKAIEESSTITRFRISSIEPNLLSEEIIQFISTSKKFLPHFHIPLQSGSDKILKLMRRKYETALYIARVEMIKSLMPHCCIGVDVITGFPGETREDFIETYEFLNKLDVSYLHVFTYSERAKTTAIKLKGKVPGSERHDRTTMLSILSEKKRRAFYEQFTGSVRPVLFEADNNGSSMYGFTDNYIKVKMTYDPMLVNEIVPVKLLQINPEGDMDGREFISSPLTSVI